MLTVGGKKGWNRKGWNRVEATFSFHGAALSEIHRCTLLDSTISNIPEDLWRLSLQTSPTLSAEHYKHLSRIALMENDPQQQTPLSDLLSVRCLVL